MSRYCARHRLIVVGHCPSCRPVRPVNPAYKRASYLRARARLMAHHLATAGPVCPRCGRREDPTDPSTKLTANHVHPLGMDGPEDGELEVLCSRCNTRLRWKLMPRGWR